jgi:hypothetical protein
MCQNIFSYVVIDSQITYRKPNALFVRLENGCHKIFGYVAAYRRDLRARPAKVMLTIQVATTDQSQAIAKSSMKRVEIRLITSVQTELKNLQALLSAEYLPLMKFVLNPMLIEPLNKNEKVLLDAPVVSARFVADFRQDNFNLGYFVEIETEQQAEPCDNGHLSSMCHG